MLCWATCQCAVCVRYVAKAYVCMNLVMHIAVLVILLICFHDAYKWQRDKKGTLGLCAGVNETACG